MTMRGEVPAAVTKVDILASVIPYVMMSLLLLIGIFFIPGIATLLPSSLG